MPNGQVQNCFAGNILDFNGRRDYQIMTRARAKLSKSR